MLSDPVQFLRIDGCERRLIGVKANRCALHTEPFLYFDEKGPR